VRGLFVIYKFRFLAPIAVNRESIEPPTHGFSREAISFCLQPNQSLAVFALSQCVKNSSKR
jgi:hypothetical protein